MIFERSLTLVQSLQSRQGCAVGEPSEAVPQEVHDQKAKMLMAQHNEMFVNILYCSSLCSNFPNWQLDLMTYKWLCF